MKQENFSGAVEEYTKAINIDNSNAVYYCNRYMGLCQCLQYVAHLPGTDNLWKRVQHSTCIYRAAAFSKMNEHSKALDDCFEALTIDPKYSKAYGRKG